MAEEREKEIEKLAVRIHSSYLPDDKRASYVDTDWFLAREIIDESRQPDTGLVDALKKILALDLAQHRMIAELYNSDPDYSQEVKDGANDLKNGGSAIAKMATEALAKYKGESTCKK